VLLRFAAVDHLAEVFVNGEPAGTHEGAYTPFVVDVTDRVKPGANELVVRVVDPPPTARGKKPRFPELPYEELPRGKQNWYIQNGGLWQPVSLDIRPALYIESVRVTPSNSGAVSVAVELAGDAVQGRTSLNVQLIDPDGRPAGTIPAQTVTGPGPLEVKASVAQPRLWTQAAPALYSVRVALSGGVADEVRDRFGFREFTARDGRFFLNGEPFYMIGALDQDFYPETIYSTPGKPYLVDMMQKGRSLGLNLLRCHIKVCDEDYLDAADETGMLVWYEVPSWDDWTDRSVARGKRIFEAMTLRDWNHPSIVIQTLINEAWGMEPDMSKADQRAGLLAWFDDAKKQVAALGRLVVDNSPCCQNFHMKTDIDDFHQYFSIPDNADRWDKWVADFASRPKWAFSPHGDAVRTGAEPLVVSEFGNWGLPELPADLPWWFPRDFDGRRITRPAGLFDRFHAMGFDRVFGDYPTLAKETQWRQFHSLKHEIETMRRHGAIQGYVITEFTDINWEANGLMDMWRRPKAYARELARIQQEDVLLLEAAKQNVAAGEPVEVIVRLSRYSANDPAGAALKLGTPSDSGGVVQVVHGSVARGEVGEIARVTVPAGMLSNTTKEAALKRLTFTLDSTDGKSLARNTLDLFVFPAPGEPAGDVVLHDPNAALAHLPWKPGAPPAGGTLVASVFDAQVRQHVEQGGTAVVALSKVLGALTGAPGLTLAERRGELDGNWVSNFPWVHASSPAFAGVALTRIMGFEARAATPRTLLAGVNESAWQQGDVLSGMFFGWINDNHATTAQFRVGKGKVVFTTFDTSAYGTDPFTTNLVHQLVSYVRSPQCAPATELN
jgi:Glycosyl hydrolases family 2/Glycosyl hydrolases family 2, sugar binding domain